MKRETLEDALDRIDPRFLEEAAAPPNKRRALPWIGAIAAILVLALLGQIIEIPMAIRAEAIALAQPRVQSRPDWEKYENPAQFDADHQAWLAQSQERKATAQAALSSMKDFLEESSAIFLTGDGNQLYSPINAAIGLSMAAELTAGNTRQQLLETLGISDTATLARYISALWESVYEDDGKDICTLANSLWLDDEVAFHQSAMDTLAHDYYASVYRQDLQSRQALKDIQDWLNSNTGNILRKSVQTVQLPELTLLALYSTIFFQAKWSDEFNAENNTQDVFHSPNGNITAEFMNKTQRQMNYYWGETFGAVALGLKNGSKMWFILPNSGKTTEDVLVNGQYLDMLLGNWENTKYARVNLSVPKFDIEAKKDLKEGLMEMGITDLFCLGTADFSASLKVPAFISAANQAVRIAIDETGVTAAAYFELPAPGEAMPPEEIIDFILDRPFLVFITDSTGIPLFAGSVQQP